jgi:hypothetical protein
VCHSSDPDSNQVALIWLSVMPAGSYGFGLHAIILSLLCLIAGWAGGACQGAVVGPIDLVTPDPGDPGHPGV